MKTIQWVQNRVRLLDQTRLPERVDYLEIGDYQELIQAIKRLAIRGAPAIGIAGGYAIVLAAQAISTSDRKRFMHQLEEAAETIKKARPTAVNLSWAVNRLLEVLDSSDDVEGLKVKLLAEAKAIQEEDEIANRRLASFGATLLKSGQTVLTHCNAGALATSDYGTALGVIRAAKEGGKDIEVFATETRPLLQGARLTSWELIQEGIPVTLITDSMAGHFMSKGQLESVVVGADRIAANGDTANKIGTYTLAVLAKEHRVPFYVAAPTSTIDLSLPSGEGIPIEERRPEEVTRIQGIQIAPEGVKVRNPAFDVTPHAFITAIITEKGIARKPYEAELRRLMGNG